MSDLLRMTGMYSGMDTESIIQQLVQAKSTKVTSLKNDQKKLEWKQTIWQDLNSRIYKLYTGTLSNMRLTGSYAKKTTKISDPTKATITATDGAVNGLQTLEVNKIAAAGYLTGGVVSKKSSEVKEDTKLSELGVKDLGTLSVTIDSQKKDFAPNGINQNSTIDDFVKEFNNQFQGDGLQMSFNEGKITVNASGAASGKTYGFSTTGASSPTIVGALGLSDCTPSDNVSGDFTGKKIHILGSDYQDESNVTLEQLNVKGGQLTVTAGGAKVNINVDKSMSVESFISKFNKENKAKGTGLTMSIENGAISVNAPAGTQYTLASTTDPSGGYTVLQGLGLGNYGGDNVSGTITGTTVPKLKPSLTAEGFKQDSLLSAIDPSLVGQTISVTTGIGGDAKTTGIKIESDMTISDLVSQLKEAGVTASFDENNQRFFISSAKTGTANEFKLEASGGALASLGLDDTVDGFNGHRVAAEDAEIVLNGVTYTSDTNTFNINGLSITAHVKTDEQVTITTDTDYDGIYNMIKDFLTEYNDIMNEMTKLYNADSARKYTMLSDEEKEAMTDDEVEKWETTIKDSLLRRDSNLYSVMECMRGAVNKGYDIGGETLFLINFGVGTGSYFDTEKAERNALHIYGDSDDEKYSDKDNELRAALAEDPDKVIEMFAAMSKEMYNSLHDTMASTDYRSIYKVYDDKRMKTEYDDYTTRIKEAEQKLNDYEDKWYKKFSAMEVALSKLQSSQNSLASMLGQ